jgi:uncharacterized protein involved in exopolysaccharide biosynthesis
MGPIYSIGDFLDLLRRRAWQIILATALGCGIAVMFALSQAHSYRSTEVIQIEQPKIADSLAPSTVDGSAARRLQLIEQQLMARSNMLDIIDDLGLFLDMPGLLPDEKVVMLREAVTITGVAAVREGVADDGTIAILTISAEMGTAEQAQAVAHEFADQTRVLTARQRQDQTRETLTFFDQQEANLIAEIATLEQEVADFRQANNLSIEGNMVILQSELGSLNDAILELDREIIATQLERNRIGENGARAATIEREQAELAAELNSLASQRQLMDDRRANLSATLETTPEIDRELAKFDRRLIQLQERLDVAAARRNEAEIAVNLEMGARGERMITIEEARVPEYPVTMSRKRLAMMGGAAAGLGAIVLAFLLELRHPVLRTAQQMERETGLRAVISIPQSPRTKNRKGLGLLWQNRRRAGQQGRAARIARNPDTTRS